MSNTPLIEDYWVEKHSDIFFMVYLNLFNRELFVRETTSKFGKREYEAFRRNEQGDEIESFSIEFDDFLPKVEKKVWIGTSGMCKDQAFFAYNLVGIGGIQYIDTCSFEETFKREIKKSIGQTTLRFQYDSKRYISTWKTHVGWSVPIEELNSNN